MLRILVLTAAALCCGVATATAGAPDAPNAGPVPARESLPVEALGQLSGGQVPAQAANYSVTEAINSGNTVTANSIATGSITVQPGAMNYHGIGNFVWNTGQNNNLQGVLNVNIVMAPAI